MDKTSPVKVCAAIAARLDEVLARLDGPGGPRAPGKDELPSADGDRIAWDAAALLYVELCADLTKCWNAGGAWREAVEAMGARNVAVESSGKGRAA